MKQEAILTIAGRVQGVFYRREAQAKALSLGITGYARNNHDGSVTVCAQGAPTALEELVKWCWHGPEEADVDYVEAVFRDEPLEIFTRFEIK